MLQLKTGNLFSKKLAMFFYSFAHLDIDILIYLYNLLLTSNFFLFI